MLKIILIFFLSQISFHDLRTVKPSDRWLVKLSENDQTCLNQWLEKSINSSEVCVKKIPIDNWYAISIPQQYSSSLMKLKCVETIIEDIKLNNFNNIPNDESFDLQNNMDLVGMPTAWDNSTGGFTSRGDTIVVAVIDDGFDIFHEDLHNNIWYNSREIPNDGLDNDSNGYADDYYGLNTSTGTDDHQLLTHGTSVSGIIGAEGNNDKGIAGVNWNVKLMTISYDYRISELIEGYQYVIEMRKKYNESEGIEGAFVVAVNLSSGIPFGNPQFYPMWCEMYNKLGEVGIIGVCSSSNSNHNVDEQGDLPASCASPYTIIVTNVDSNDVKVEDASFGRISVDLAAPGNYCITTYTDNSYNLFTGTSASAPHVTGAIALLYSALSQECFETINQDPGIFALNIKNIILTSGTPNESLKNITLSGKRLQVDKALELANCSIEAMPTNQIKIRFLAPNPASNTKVKVYFESTILYNSLHLEIFSITGNLLYSYSILEEDAKEGYIEIEINDLPCGVYIVNIKSGSSVDSSKLVIL